MAITELISQHIADNGGFESLTIESVETAKEMMLNAAAVSLAAAAQPDGQVITKFVQEMGGNGKCTIIGQGLRSSPAYASLANGLMVRLLDFDDEIIPLGVHPSCTVFPVVMALGEMTGSTGQDVIRAFVHGCDITSKLSRLLSDNGINNLISIGFPNTKLTPEVIGSTVAAGIILGLDSNQLEHALTISTDYIHGMTNNNTRDLSPLISGQIAMQGVISGSLAQLGLSDQKTRQVNSDRLFTRDTAQSEAELLSHLGRTPDISEPGITLKLYPCNSASHSVIDAALRLVQLHRIEARQIKQVHVSITEDAMERLCFSNPVNAWEARSSMSYITAIALLHGHPLIDFFSDSALEDSEVRLFMDRISVEATEKISPLAPYPSTISIELDNGQKIYQTTEFARGQPQLPLEEEELDAKFLYCSRYILPPDHIEEAIDSFRGLENIANITGMASVLGG